MSWVVRLKEKWGITSQWQFIVIMLVFACTGSTVVFVKKPLIAMIFENGIQPLWFKIAYWVLILPIYNCLLLFYGFLFRQFDFFWRYEKKMLSRFSRKKNVETQ